MIDNSTNCGKIMYCTLVCIHRLDFNQYGVSPKGEVPKVQLDAPIELKGKITTKEVMGE
jgi:hypothetical protein